MIYEMECDCCEKRTDIVCSISDHEKMVKPGIPCSCGGTSTQVFLRPYASAFTREPFPANDPRWEHATNDGEAITCKSHLKDVCAREGSISRYLEDAM